MKRNTLPHLTRQEGRALTVIWKGSWQQTELEFIPDTPGGTYYITIWVVVLLTNIEFTNHHKKFTILPKTKNIYITLNLLYKRIIKKKT